jgi:hypothetical protein
MFAFLHRFASGFLREGLGTMPEKFVAREKRKIADATPPTPPLPRQRPAISVPNAITRNAPPPYRWTYPLTFTSAAPALARIPTPAPEQPKRTPGPYSSPISRHNPWLPKVCIYKGRAAYWLPGEAWINDPFGIWRPTDDIAVMFFGDFVTPGEFIRAFPHLAMLPDEAFHLEEKMNGRLDQSSESGGRSR